MLSLSELAPRRLPATWILVAGTLIVFAVSGAWLVWVGFDAMEVGVSGRPYRARLLVGGQVSGPIRAGAWWRLATSTLLHVDLLHLLLNSVALAVLGYWLEQVVGSLRWLGLFALAAVGASLVSHAFGVAQSDGASAGGLALLAGGGLLAWRQRDALGEATRAVLPWLAGFLVVNLVLTALWAAVDATGHAAGVVLGVGLGAVLPLRAGRIEGAAWAAVLVVYCAMLAWGVAAMLG